MKHRLAPAAALLVGAVLTVSACSSSGGSPTNSSSDPVTSSASLPSTPPTSSTPSTSPTSAADVAEQQAVEFVPMYLAELDKLYSDPTVSINDIYTVAVQPESTDDALGIAKYRSSNYRQTGTQKLVNVSDPSVHLSGLGDGSPNAAYPTVQMTACVDVSGVKVTDAQGKPAGDPNSPAFLIESLTIVNVNYPSSGGWRVSNAPNKQATSCAG